MKYSGVNLTLTLSDISTMGPSIQRLMVAPADHFSFLRFSTVTSALIFNDIEHVCRKSFVNVFMDIKHFIINPVFPDHGLSDSFNPNLSHEVVGEYWFQLRSYC